MNTKAELQFILPEVIPPQGLAISDGKFSRMRWADALSGAVVPCHCYGRVDKNRYLPLFRSGETYQRQKLLAPSYQGEVPWVYFVTDERSLVISQLAQLTKHLITENRSPRERLEICRNLAELYLAEIIAKGPLAATSVDGRILCEGMLAIVKDDKELAGLLLEMGALDHHEFSESFLIAFISSMIVARMPWGSKLTVEHVTLGGLLHDIGKQRLPIGLREKKHHLMDEIEIRLWREHPRLGVEMLDNSDWIPEAVKQIVYQHHELANGTGFPNGLTEYYIYPMAKVVSFAHVYADFLLAHQLSPLDGIKAFLRRPGVLEKFDSSVVRTFLTCFVLKSKPRKEGVT